MEISKKLKELINDDLLHGYKLKYNINNSFIIWELIVYYLKNQSNASIHMFYMNLKIIILVISNLELFIKIKYILKMINIIF